MSTGPELEIPCPGCGRPNDLDLERLAAQGADARCLHCGTGLVVLGEAMERPEPEPDQLVPDLSSLPTEGGYASERLEAPEGRAATPPSSEASMVEDGAVSCPSCGHRFTPVGRGDERASVLIVEDTDFFLQLATDVLGQSYRTIGVKTATDALEALNREEVDLLVLDLSLPDGAGEEILRASRKDGLPVLIYTSASERLMLGDAWRRLQGLGASDLLLKGVNVEEALLEKVDALLGAR